MTAENRVPPWQLVLALLIVGGLALGIVYQQFAVKPGELRELREELREWRAEWREHEGIKNAEGR